MTEIKKPVLSNRFDVEDIQILREYNSLRHIQMTPREIVNETKASLHKLISELYSIGKYELAEKLCKSDL